MSSAVAKPQLRGMLEKAIKKHLMIGIVLSIAGGFGYKFLISEPRKRRYAEFYKNYDAEKDFEYKRSKGIFQSC